MRALLAVLLVACARPSAPPPPPVAAVVDAGQMGGSSYQAPAPAEPPRCDATKKPRAPVADTPEACARAAGRWVDDWPKEAGTGTGWHVLGRGNRRFRGCAHIPAADANAACAYDWDCQGACTDGRCARFIEPSAGLGCAPRCVDGVVRVVCVD